MAQLKLSDGRFLEVLDNGVVSERALVLHHGTPSDATAWTRWLEHAGQRGLRAISSSRPGYGESDRHHGRRVVDVNEDTRHVLVKLGIESFVALGWSGGGPHALANGLDERCKGVVTLAGVAAYGQDDLDFLAGMGPENHEEFGAAEAGEAELDAWMQKNAPGLQHITGLQLRDALGGLVGEVDRSVLKGDFADDLAANMRHALYHGFAGWIDDDLAFTKAWGFSLASIRCAVELWQGDQDLMVPQAHANWLHRKLPASDLNVVPGHGHLSLITDYRDAVFNQVQELLV